MRDKGKFSDTLLLRVLSAQSMMQNCFVSLLFRLRLLLLFLLLVLISVDN